MVTLTEMRDAIRMLGVRGWFLAALGGLGTLLLIGIPAAVFDNPFFARPLEVRSQDYVLWGAAAVLAGLIIGTYARPLPATDGGGGKAVTGGFLSFVAVSCPICNKVAVTLLGTSGAADLLWADAALHRHRFPTPPRLEPPIAGEDHRGQLRHRSRTTTDLRIPSGQIAT